MRVHWQEAPTLKGFTGVHSGVQRWVTVLLGILCLSHSAGCARENVTHPVVLSEGTYRVTFGQGYPPADEALLLAVTAHLDRTSNLLVSASPTVRNGR